MKKTDETLPLTMLCYDEDTPDEVLVQAVNQGNIPKNNFWLRVVGLQNTDLLFKIGQVFNIHELIIEDIIHTTDPAKYEKHDNYSFFITKILQNLDGEITSKQLSIILGEDYLITFEEIPSAYIRTYHDKIEKSSKTPTPQQITYNILDHIIDNYVSIINGYQAQAEEIEDDLLEDHNDYNLKLLFSLKREIHALKRIIRPMQDITDRIVRVQDDTFSPKMTPYIKDLWDHMNKAIGMTDGVNETLNSIHTEILTQLQYKFSRTMNIMTAVSVIFLPLMVITGVYGMNFDYMPELHYKHAYFVVLGILVFIGSSLFIIFVKRRVIY